jgi:hypothetical protein
MVPIFNQPIYSALESLEARRLLSAGHHAHDGSAPAEDGGAIVMNINVSAGPVQQGQIIGAQVNQGGDALTTDNPNLAGDDGQNGSVALNPGGQPHGHGFWTRGPQPPVKVTPTPTDSGNGNGADAGGSGTTDSGSGNPGTGMTPPPVAETPPPVEVNPPHAKTDPPPVDVTPPPVDVTPPPTDVTPPPVDVTPPPTDVTPPPVDVNPPPVDVTPPPVDVIPPPTNVTPPPADVTPPPVTPPTTTPPTTDSNPPPVASTPPPSAHQSTPPTQSGSGSFDSGNQSQAHSGQTETASTNSGSSTSTTATQTPSDASQANTSESGSDSQTHADHGATGSAAVASDSGSNSSSAQQSRPEGHDASLAVSASSAAVVTPAEPSVANSTRTDAGRFSQVKIDTTGASPVQTDNPAKGSSSENALERLMAMVFGQSPYGHVHGAVSADAPMGDVSADEVQVQTLSNVLVDSGEAQLSASSISADAAPAASPADSELVLARPPQAQASFRTPVDEGGAFNPHNIMAAVLAGITFGAIHFHRWRKRRQEAAIASARKLASMLTFDPLAVWIDHPRRRR